MLLTATHHCAHFHCERSVQSCSSLRTTDCIRLSTVDGPRMPPPPALDGIGGIVNGVWYVPGQCSQALANPIEMSMPESFKQGTLKLQLLVWRECSRGSHTDILCTDQGIK